MSKLFQIHEDDLAELERFLPLLYERMGPQGVNQNSTKVMVRRVKEILSHVRWDYAPHSEMEVVPADPDDPTIDGDGWKNAGGGT